MAGYRCPTKALGRHAPSNQVSDSFEELAVLHGFAREPVFICDPFAATGGTVASEPPQVRPRPARERQLLRAPAFRPWLSGLSAKRPDL
jgi:hypothetical protein